jgi:4-amino-4-deoxy-L-arabinose transferase-like glycosyltransferase
MATRPATAARATTLTRSIPWVLISYLAIGLVALLPRVLNLGVFLVGDEANFWLRRSDTFLRAIQSGDWAATAISTHPGITTMWLGSAGIVLRRALFAAGLLHDASFPTVLTFARLPTALAHITCVLIGYGLLRRLLNPVPAVLAALLWATDPFMIAFSRVLHVDALAGSFATVSLLAACLHWHHDPRRRWLILSGVCAGLAILSKSPALALLPAVGMIGLAAAWRQDERRTTNDEEAPKSFALSPASLIPLLAWGAIVAVTVFALWPALWVSPIAAYRQVRLGVEAEGAEPHMLGNFFLGQEDDSPGLLFYPVALVLRLTPWGLLGLLALPLALRRARPATRRDLAALAGFLVLFIVAMSLFPKKFNRYLIPAWPVVDILAAAGLAWMVDFRFQMLDPRISQSKIKNLLSKVGLSLIVLASIANAAWYHPYGIVYFNQLLGGAQAGAHTFVIGWGEGLDQVADWLNQQPDITGVRVATTLVAPLQSYLRDGAQAISPDGPLPNKTGYVVVYVRHVQWGSLYPPFDQFYGRVAPVHVVQLHGVDYAWIYQVPPPVAQPLPADFGATIHLRGLTLNQPAQRGKPLALKLFWQMRDTAPADYTLFAHLIGPDGQRYAHVDLPYPTSQWRPSHFASTDLPLPLPPDAPAGSYRLVIGFYDPASQQRLPLTAASALDPAIDGPEALLLTVFELK